MLLTAEKVTISNIPDIIDVNKLIELLRSLKVKIEQLDKNTYTFQADALDLDYLESEDFRRDGKSLRGSIMIVGPLLARFGKGYIPKPGVIKSDEEDWIRTLKDLSILELLSGIIKKNIFMELKLLMG